MRNIGTRRITLIAIIAVLLVIGVAIGLLLWWFLPTYPLVVITDPTEGGVATGTGDYHRNTDVQITAQPNECYEFSGWTGVIVATPSSSSTTAHVSSSGQVVTAHFERYCIPPGANHEYWEYFGKSPSYLTLDNNEEATNPSWGQLKTFLKNDKTEQETYVEHLFMGVDFALLLHDNSEASGIRAAYVWVEVGVADKGFGRALNAFETTDQGLVFVDCTGFGKYSYDKIAFIELGKEYGLINLDVVESFSYGGYEQYMADWEAYEDSREQYIEDADYLTEVLGRCGDYCTDTGGECDCQRLWSWSYELERWLRQLDRQYEKLGGDYYETGGMVKEVEIWW